MTFTAAGIALSVETKATADNNWQGVQQVAVQVGDEMKPYTVTPSTDYKTAELSSADAPFYWQSTDPITVSAWWPYTDGSTTMPDVVVQADQSSEASFHGSDYICALDQTVEFDGPHALQFSHRTAKVVVNPLVNGDGMTADELARATIAFTGVTTGNEADGNTVTPYGNSIALLPAQQIPADEPFIQVTLANGVIYSYTPDKAVELKEGYQYTYTITVHKTRLGVEEATISGWGDGGNTAGEALPPTPSYVYDEATNTYYVYDADGLLAWADFVREGHWDTNCTLMADIDYKDGNWTPVADFSNNYTGTFDGNGHTLGSMQISSTDNLVGLFAVIGDGGEVRDVTFKDITVTESDKHPGGVIAGINDGGTISHCRVEDCTVGSFPVYSGGMVGINYTTISCCEVVDVKITGNATSTGGIAGDNIGSIIACSFSGEVSARLRCGGIVGRNLDGNILACWADAQASDSYLGGVCGSYDRGSVTACYWAGSATVGIDDANNNPDTTVKVDGTTVTWQSACDAMNAALPAEFGWQWTTDGGSLPTLVPNE